MQSHHLCPSARGPAHWVHALGQADSPTSHLHHSGSVTASRQVRRPFLARSRAVPSPHTPPSTGQEVHRPTRRGPRCARLMCNGRRPPSACPPWVPGEDGLPLIALPPMLRHSPHSSSVHVGRLPLPPALVTLLSGPCHLGHSTVSATHVTAVLRVWLWGDRQGWPKGSSLYAANFRNLAGVFASRPSTLPCRRLQASPSSRWCLLVPPLPGSTTSGMRLPPPRSRSLWAGAYHYGTESTSREGTGIHSAHIIASIAGTPGDDSGRGVQGQASF